MDSIIKNILSSGSSIQGEFIVTGSVRLDGDFTGKLISPESTVIIGKKSKVKSDLKAKDIIIAGQVKGNIEVSRKLTILKTGKLTGDLSSPSLIMEEGCSFHGRCFVRKDSHAKQI